MQSCRRQGKLPMFASKCIKMMIKRKQCRGVV
jgi:hypothetical protein